MVSFPPSKINLGLRVTGKRPDGYHNIETCFYAVPWTDVLDIVPADDFSFSVSGIPIPGDAADNLCVRAYQLLKREFKLQPVAMHLLKLVPIGAGLGGGSADGAFALKSLNALFNLALSRDELCVLAAQLGSDCAFFIDSQPMIGTGRGEVLTETTVSLKGRYLVIVKPDVHVSTASAYAAITPTSPAHDLRAILEHHPVEDWRHLLKNDFEDHVFARFPVIRNFREKLYTLGATYASMSGSGSAVFGIFDQPIDAAKEFKDLHYWSGYPG